MRVHDSMYKKPRAETPNSLRQGDQWSSSGGMGGVKGGTGWEGRQGTSWDDGTVPYIECDAGYRNVYLGPTSVNHPRKIIC